MIPFDTLCDYMSGRDQSWSAHLFRATTRCCEPLVRWYVQRKNTRYDVGVAEMIRVDRPVICVGNLTVGGTGKSPFVLWLATQLLAQGVQPVLVSRGYRSRQGAANDEAAELARRLPELKHYQQADRVAAARLAIREHPDCVLLLDDGFQHRRLQRDLDIVLLDALHPFGYEHLLPRGLLREPVESLARAQVVVLTRANFIEAHARDAIEQRVRKFQPNVVWGEAEHRPVSLVNHAGQEVPISDLASTPVVAFCGIGNPLGFRRTLEQLGYTIAAWQPFPDHHAYTPADAARLVHLAQQTGAQGIVCTEKDLVKLQTSWFEPLECFALRVRLALTRGEDQLVQRVRDARA